METVSNHNARHHLPYAKPPEVENNRHQHHQTLSSTSLVIIVLCGISAAVLVAVLFISLMFRRLKNRTCNKSGLKHAGITNADGINSGRFNKPHTVIDFNSSPNVKVGCGVQGGNLVPTKSPAQFKGVQVFTYKELELATNKFNHACVIGNGGGHGVVYRGVLSDGSVAAIKVLDREGKHGERAFRMEVDLLSRLHSPYLVGLLGYCADSHHRLLIFQYMPNGTLHQHLHHPNQHRPLDWGTRLRIALDCARALEFLHEHASPAVIHRDFKCTSVLLDHNLRARVSDLGLAKISGQISKRVMGTTGYLAPEYASTGKLTTKSDVYSYGVVLLQLITGRIPVDTERPAGEHVLVSWALPRLTIREKVAEMVDPALSGRYSKKELIQVAAIAAMCVQPEADYRPLMTDVVQSLVPLVKNLSSSSYRFHSRISSPK